MLTPPLVVAYGVGVDSTAMLVGLHQRGERPDLILFADTGDEKAAARSVSPWASPCPSGPSTCAPPCNASQSSNAKQMNRADYLRLLGFYALFIAAAAPWLIVLRLLLKGI